MRRYKSKFYEGSSAEKKAAFLDWLICRNTPLIGQTRTNNLVLDQKFYFFPNRCTAAKNLLFCSDDWWTVTVVRWFQVRDRDIRQLRHGLLSCAPLCSGTYRKPQQNWAEEFRITLKHLLKKMYIYSENWIYSEVMVQCAGVAPKFGFRNLQLLLVVGDGHFWLPRLCPILC